MPEAWMHTLKIYTGMNDGMVIKKILLEENYLPMYKKIIKSERIEIYFLIEYQQQVNCYPEEG